MKVIVLEHPRMRSEHHFNEIANTPLWSSLMAGYATSAIRATQAEVQLLDTAALGWDFLQTANAVVKQSPQLLCIHAVYFWEPTSHLFDFFSTLRSLGFTGHLNLFGFFPTLAHDIILKTAPAVDSIAVGECEATLAALTIHLGQGAPWQTVRGLACRRPNGEVALIRREPEPEPDRFPRPVRPSCGTETVSILASRGCYNHCRFCPIPVFYNNGPKWRGRSPQSVADEIVHLHAQGVSDFYFVDPNFIGPGAKGKKRTITLCRLLEPLGISFGIETRAADIDDEVLAALKAAGMESLLIGIESGSKRVLNDLDKRASIDISEHAIDICRNGGIEPEVGFLMFVPDSELSDLIDNLGFLKRNRLLDRLDRTVNLLCHRQIVFMNTSGYRRFLAQERIVDTDFLGFKVEIAYRDPRVRWISDVMRHVCLFVLRETGCPKSVLYFEKNKTWRRFRHVNDYLVDLFGVLLDESAQKKEMDSITKQTYRLEMETRLRKIIGA